MKSNNKLPLSVAFIMDGNGRWAEKRGLKRKDGHRVGVDVLLDIAKYAFRKGIKYVTVYAFSTENKKRPLDEVSGLMSLMRQHFKSTFKEFKELGIKLVTIGDKSYFPNDINQGISELEEESESLKGGVFCLALNYGGRDEIINAVNKAAKSKKKVTEETFKEFLYTKNIPDPDLIIRTGGEMRLSNFLLYQSAYSELFFTNTLWPDFERQEFDKILDDYALRNRRFGGVDVEDK